MTMMSFSSMIASIVVMAICHVTIMLTITLRFSVQCIRLLVRSLPKVRMSTIIIMITPINIITRIPVPMVVSKRVVLIRVVYHYHYGDEPQDCQS